MLGAMVLRSSAPGRYMRFANNTLWGVDKRINRGRIFAMVRTQDTFMHLRVSKAEKKLIDEAAKKAGLSSAAYVKMVMATLSTGVIKSSDDELDKSLDMVGAAIRARQYRISEVEPEPDDSTT